VPSLRPDTDGLRQALAQLVSAGKPAGVAAAADPAGDEETHIVLLRRLRLLLLRMTGDREQESRGHTEIDLSHGRPSAPCFCISDGVISRQAVQSARGYPTES
jgi:hypothetical protein